MGPHLHCRWRFTPSDKRNLLKREARNSSSALPELMKKKREINKPHQRDKDFTIAITTTTTKP